MMKHTTKPVSDLCWAYSTERLPLRARDKWGDEHTIERICWVGNTCYVHTAGEGCDFRARYITHLEETE